MLDILGGTLRVFKLISFVGDDKPTEYIIDLPSFIHRPDIRDVELIVAWGLTAFRTSDSSVYLINLV
jgi:hypothetical protein